MLVSVMVAEGGDILGMVSDEVFLWLCGSFGDRGSSTVKVLGINGPTD